MKDGITEKYTNCKHCGSKCNHDDDCFDECRFCNASPKDKNGKVIPVNEADTCVCAS